MRCTGANESKGIELAIICVGKARSQQLTQRLLEYLLGEKDQIPKVEQTKTKKIGFLLKHLGSEISLSILFKSWSIC
jgi:hypothetical protein